MVFRVVDLPAPLAPVSYTHLMLHTSGKDMGQLTGLLLLGSGNRSLGSSLGALALQCADLNCLAAQLAAQLLQVDLIAVLDVYKRQLLYHAFR